MRRLLVPIVLLAGTFLVSPGSAQATTDQSSASASASEQATKRTTRVKVTYPKAIKRGWPVRYTFKITNPDEIEDEALVLETDLPHGIVSKVRFVTKPPGAKCGVQKRNSVGNYAVYCVVRSLDYDRFNLSFKVWIKPSYYGKFRAGHYWAPVTLDFGGSIKNYLDKLTKEDLIGNTWTKVR